MVGVTGNGEAAGRGLAFAPEPAPELPTLISFLARERGWPLRLWWLAMPLAIATLLTYLRLLTGFGSAGVPLVFYFPAIIATTLTAGLRFGAASLAATLLLVWFLFAPPMLTFLAPTHDQIVTLVLWALVSGILICLAYFLRLSLQQLSRNEARYRKLVAVTSDIVWVTDGDGNVHMANPAWSRITGVAWPDFSGLKWAQSVHEEDRRLLMPSSGGVPDFHQAEFRLWDAASNDWRWFRSRAVGITSPDGGIEEWITAMRDVHEPRLARERAAIMLGESRHRLKNLVTIIDALAKSSRPAAGNSTSETDAFLKRFVGRLHALGAAADLALAGDNRIMDLGAAARATLAPFTEGNQHIEISGPDTILSQETGGSVALALHELATNAIKYGALSVPDGSVSLTWEATPVAGGEQVVITWKEHGGPLPKPPEKSGFGTRVIRAAASRERDGQVEIDYPADGLFCRLSFTQAMRTETTN